MKMTAILCPLIIYLIIKSTPHKSNQTDDEFNQLHFTIRLSASRNSDLCRHCVSYRISQAPQNIPLKSDTSL